MQMNNYAEIICPYLSTHDISQLTDKNNKCCFFGDLESNSSLFCLLPTTNVLQYLLTHF